MRGERQRVKEMVKENPEVGARRLDQVINAPSTKFLASSTWLGRAHTGPSASGNTARKLVNVVIPHQAQAEKERAKAGNKAKERAVRDEAGQEVPRNHDPSLPKDIVSSVTNADCLMEKVVSHPQSRLELRKRLPPLTREVRRAQKGTNEPRRKRARKRPGRSTLELAQQGRTDGLCKQ